MLLLPILFYEGSTGECNRIEYAFIWEKNRKLNHHFYLQCSVLSTSLAFLLQTARHCNSHSWQCSNPSGHMTIEGKGQFSQESVGYWSEAIYDLPTSWEKKSIQYCLMDYYKLLWDKFFLPLYSFRLHNGGDESNTMIKDTYMYTHYMYVCIYRI